MSGVRLDAVLLSCLDTLVSGNEKASMLWNAGGREVAREKLKEIGVSSKPVTLVDLARGVGFLGPDPDVIEVENRPKRRKGARRVSA